MTKRISAALEGNLVPGTHNSMFRKRGTAPDWCWQQSAESRTSCAVTCSHPLFFYQDCAAGDNCWGLTALSGQPEEQCFCQKQHWAAGGTATAISRPQEFPRRWCQHPRPKEKVKSLITPGYFGILWFLPVQPMGFCCQYVPAGCGYSHGRVQHQKKTLVMLGRRLGRKQPHAHSQ